MPTITLSDQAFTELKSLAEPFVDTPESLTARLIHEAVMRKEAQSGVNRTDPVLASDVPGQNPISHDTLAHTRLISATVDGREIYRPKWNGLMNHLHILGLQRLGSFEALRQASSARLRQGRFEEEGFKYLPEGDFSIQGVDANLAWDHAFKLARTMAIPIKAVFEWRDKPAAVHPGRRGLLDWSPAEASHLRTPKLAHQQQAGDFRKQVTEISSNA